ncbi:hypoxanthine phosphoribosyltransferase [Parcubacteria bacterium DG_74_2]|nr:MAG: hypoxanthine phosphoribosyltransferase [Parcubacteria bacterium DG_74_2]
MEKIKKLLSERKIKSRVKKLAQAISIDYQEKNLLLVCILKGAVVFLSDLLREITIPFDIDFVGLASYGSHTKTTGTVRLTKDLETDIKDRGVLIIEDIVDTGLTLDYLVKKLKEREPASLRICTLLNKPSRRQVKIRLDYIGFKIPNKFVVGYGMDYAGKYRNLPFVGHLPQSAR